MSPHTFMGPLATPSKVVGQMFYFNIKALHAADRLL